MADKNKKYKRSLENAGTVADYIDAIYSNNPKEEFLGEPEHHYDFTQSEEWANAHGYYPDKRGHRDDRVKKPTHPSHPSKGTWEGNNFILTNKGLADPNYIFFGLNDGGQDPQAILKYKDTYVIPEFTVTPKGNYINNSYDNIRLHFKKGGIHTSPSKRSIKDASRISDENYYNNKITYNTTSGGGYIPSVENINDILENVSGDIMEGIRKFAYPKAKVIDKNKGKGYNGGTAQRTYLLPRHIQKDIFLRDGYIEGREGDYGLVKKAVGNRNIPVFQTAKDAITRDNLIPFSSGYRGQSNFEDKFIDENKELVHAGGYPYALYIDGTNGNIYYKAWDLNDYTEDSSRLGQKGSLERKFKSIGSKVLDVVGSPTVVTTGFQPVTNLGAYFGYNLPNANIQDLFQDYNKDLDIKDYPSNIGAKLDYFMEGKGLHREKINNKYVYTLPEITVTRNKKSNGGSIHIAPSKRGTFTAAATKHGMGVQEFASKVLRNKDSYSPAMVKKANFARNASKWH